MLPNHAPLMVAEHFKVLEALYPGRIDLGIGRAPGTDPATSYALRRRQGSARRTISSSVPGTDAAGDARFPEGHRSPRCAPSRRRYRCRRSICWARRTSRRSSPTRSARRSPSRITSRPRRGEGDAALPHNFRPSGTRASPARSWRRMSSSTDTDAEAERLADHGRARFRAPRQRRLSAAGLAGGRRGLRLHPGRSRAHRAERAPLDGRLAGDGQGPAWPRCSRRPRPTN